MNIKKVHTTKITNNFIDKETGELLDTTHDEKHVKIIVPSREAFFWTYNTVLGLIDDLSKTEMKLLHYACLNAQWNKNIISFSKPVCEDIEKYTGFSYQTVKNTVGGLSTKHILIPLGSGMYRINPKYYWRGDSNERMNTLKFILEVECPECLAETTKTSFEGNKDFLKESIEEQGI